MYYIGLWVVTHTMKVLTDSIITIYFFMYKEEIHQPFMTHVIYVLCVKCVIHTTHRPM